MGIVRAGERASYLRNTREKHPKLGLSDNYWAVFVCFSHTEHKNFRLFPLKMTWRLFVSPLALKQFGRVRFSFGSEFHWDQAAMEGY